jgi:hypothetical protein
MDVIGHIGRSISPRSPHSADTGTTQSMLKPFSLLHHYEHSYLELHGAFSIALRAPGAALLSRFGFLAGRGAQEISLAVVLGGGALRGGKTSPLRWVAEDRRAGDREGTPSPLRLLKFRVVGTLKLALGGVELWLQADSLIVIGIAVVGCHDCIL